MSIDINVGGTWKTITDCGINVGGTWKTPSEIHINVAGTWKKVWPTGPAVSALANGDYNSGSTGTIYVGVKFATDGEEYERTPIGGYGTTVGTWLDAGTSSEVWVEYIKNSGTSFVGKTPGTRYQLSSDQQFYLTATSLISYRTINCYFKFWDAATGGNLLDTTGSASWTAEHFGGGGPCSTC